ncbi:hypothetical protein P3T24_001913 [Paraburkholderia sp. GAS33]
MSFPLLKNASIDAPDERRALPVDQPGIAPADLV